uniref:Uncharacterized protein n=1 Tax=Acrobeloides nanus TaxID=290746 RepID=A0A914C160_9BILA
MRTLLVFGFVVAFAVLVASNENDQVHEKEDGIVGQRVKRQKSKREAEPFAEENREKRQSGKKSKREAEPFAEEQREKRQKSKREAEPFAEENREKRQSGKKS